VATVFLLLLPLAVNEDDERRRLAVGWPAVSSGDEPHYLVALNSLLDDGDLDLADDYWAAAHGWPQAGRRFAGAPLGHHTAWYVGERHVGWGAVYEVEPSLWQRDASGAPQPVVRPHARGLVRSGPEYPSHPAGHVLLMAPLLFPLRGTAWVEPAALFVSGVVTIAALLLFRRLVALFVDDPGATAVIAAVTFLGTPLWHYGRSLFAEPYLACCAIAAYAVALRARSAGAALAAGAFVGVGMLMKPPFGVIAIPLAVALGRALGRRAALASVAPGAVAAALVLASNAWMFGAPWRFAQPLDPGNPAAGAAGLLFSPLHGVVPIAPIALVAAAGWPALLRTSPDAWAPGCAFVLYFAVMAIWNDWRGGFCHGPRLVVPVLPLLCLGLAGILRAPMWRVRAVRASAIALALVSIAFSGWAAFHHVAAFDGHLLAAIAP